jgi:hypothetical protein
VRRTFYTLVGITLIGVLMTPALGPRRAGAQPVPPRPALAANPAEVSVTCNNVGAHTGRLYRTMFGRAADRGGLLYWVGQRSAGLTGEQIAYWMSQSQEFRSLYAHLDDGAFVDSLYRNLLGREPDPGGRVYWGEMVITHGRYNVASWMTQTPELAAAWPYVSPPICARATQLGLVEVRPGIAVGRQGSTVTVLADRSLVRYRAVNTGRSFASAIPGDVVVNANWFTLAGPIGPVVTDGRSVGGPDLAERGQIVDWGGGCPAGIGLEHVWTWRIWTPDGCARAAVSGVSLVHKGFRADAYTGINLTTGATNTGGAHSFIGFNQTEIIVVSTQQMAASRLADYALWLGAREGVMLDGGGSTQIKTPTTQLTTYRPVPTFAVLDSLAR